MSGLKSITVNAKANQNTLFIREKSSWLFYVLAILATYGALSFLSPFIDAHGVWTILHTLHAFITFGFFHVIRGSPIDDEQGKIADQSWWVQLKHSEARATPRFLIVVPTIVYMIAAYYTHEHVALAVPNLLSYVLLVVIPKM